MKTKKILSLLLAVAMMLSLLCVGAMASDEASASGEASSESSASGEASSTASVEQYIGNQPILQTHVYVQSADEDTAQFIVKGYYTYDESVAPTDSYEDTDDYVGIVPFDAAEVAAVSVTGYAGDEPELTASVEAGEGTDLVLTLSGISALADNAAYSVAVELADGTVTDSAVVYIVTAENAAYETQQTLEIGDYSLDVTDYAYLQITEQQYGGSQGLFSADDFQDTAELPAAEKEAVNWYLNSAVTNCGDDWFTFGYDADYLRLEAVHFLYKIFTIEAGNGIIGFTGDANPIGGGYNEYKYFSATTTALHAFMFEGAFESTGFGRISDGTFTSAGMDLLTTGMDRAASLLNGFTTVTGEDMLVMIYNALVGGYASLSEEGLAVQAELLAAADVTDEDIANVAEALSAYTGVLFSEGDNWNGDLITQPNLAAIFYTSNEDKIAALEAVGITADNLGELTKGEAAVILYQLDGLQTYRTFYENDDISGSPKDNLNFWWSTEDESLITVEDGEAVYTVDEADTAGEVEIDGTSITITGGQWYNHPVTGNSDDAYAGEASDSALYINGGAQVTLIDSIAASSGNVRSDSEYKYGVGGGIVIHGAGTVVDIKNTTGGLNLIGGGSYSNTVNMAGGLFVGMGAVAHYENAQLFSYNQHPSNTCYSGVVIYDNSYLSGNSGRIFSTDFFGGYVIVDETVYNKSGINMYLDETSTLLCVNSFLPGLSGANTGISQAYFQNCLVYNISSIFGFSNNTSMPDDVATGTFVNCDLHWNDGSNGIATVSREQKAYVTFVDTTVDMDEYADGYMFKVTGDEFKINASLMLELVGTDLPAEDVFVAGGRTYSTGVLSTVATGDLETIETNGTTMYVKADENSSATLRQKLNDTAAVNSYSAKKEGDGTYTVSNTGTISVYDAAVDSWIATGLSVLADGTVEVLNDSYAELVEADGVYTATYTIGTVTVILEYAA